MAINGKTRSNVCTRHFLKAGYTAEAATFVSDKRMRIIFFIGTSFFCYNTSSRVDSRSRPRLNKFHFLSLLFENAIFIVNVMPDGTQQNFSP